LRDKVVEPSAANDQGSQDRVVDGLLLAAEPDHERADYGRDRTDQKREVDQDVASDPESQRDRRTVGADQANAERHVAQRLAIASPEVAEVDDPDDQADEPVARISPKVRVRAPHHGSDDRLENAGDDADHDRVDDVGGEAAPEPRERPRSGGRDTVLRLDRRWWRLLVGTLLRRR